MNVEATVRALADVEAIRDLGRRYAHCVWQRDAAGAVALFVDDGEMDMGDRPAIHGRKALLESYESMFQSSEFRPMLHNHVVELDGDRATGTCYLDLRAVVDGRAMVGLGYYRDRYVRARDGWKFQSRVLTMYHFEEADDPKQSGGSGSAPEEGKSES
jgi:ketosteroid isomerase-like protein